MTAPDLPKLDRRRSSFYSAFDNVETDVKPRQVYPKSNDDKKEILSALKSAPLLRLIPEHELSDIVDSFFLFNVTANQLIVKQGEEGYLFFIIRSGLFEVSVNDKPVRAYKNSGYFGELALMYGQPRSATVRSVTDGQLWAIDRLTFKQNVNKAAQTTRGQYMSYLKKSLSDGDLCDLADSFRLYYFEEGEKIISQGDVADSMYLVLEGEVAIVMERSQGNKILKICTKGDYFGEFSLLTTQLRIASAVAQTDKVTVASIDSDTFSRVQQRCMTIMEQDAAEYNSVLQDIFKEFQA